MPKTTNAFFRAVFYLAIEVILIAVFLFIYNKNSFIGNTSLYLNSQIVSVVFAFVAGILALIKYYTRKKSKYIFIGVGLLGASFIDIFFTTLNNTALYREYWRWDPSIAYFSIFALTSYIIWYIEVVINKYKREHQHFWFILSIILSAILLLIFSTLKLPKTIIIYTTVICLVPSIILFLKKGVWKFKYFEYWFLASLIIAVWSNLLFLQLSVQPHDLAFTIYQICKVFFYGLLLTGLLTSTFNAFVLVEQYGETLEARLKASILSFPLGYVLLSIKGEIETANQAVFDLLGVSNNTDLNITLSSKLNIHKLCVECIEKKKSLKINSFAYNNRFLNIYLTPVIYSTDVVGTVVLMQDITEEKLLDKTKDEFIALASHELRTPLSAIKGNAELLLDHYKQTLAENNIDQMILDIHTSSIRLIDIVEEFLDITSLEQQRISFKLGPFDIYMLLQESAESMRKLANDRGNHIVTEKIGTGPFTVNADKIRTRQIMFNLVGNAIKFTDHGEIKLTAKQVDDKFIEVLISDTGRGIKSSSQKFLFKKFQQIDEDILLHDSTKGVGLGLYISKMLAEGMHGDIYLVSSEVGKGTVFGLKLPVA
jgi:signal transduction histidine kinase